MKLVESKTYNKIFCGNCDEEIDMCNNENCKSTPDINTFYEAEMDVYCRVIEGGHNKHYCFECGEKIEKELKEIEKQKEQEFEDAKKELLEIINEENTFNWEDHPNLKKHFKIQEKK